jgi:cytochrome c biogenesis protein CcmG/thiol:disulfide interchange protein DsbE
LSNQIEIIGLNYKDTEKNAMKFLKDFNNPYTLNLLDLEGIVAIEWGAYGVPETFLIYNKKIIKKFIGPINNNSLLEIKKMIK